MIIIIYRSLNNFLNFLKGINWAHMNGVFFSHNGTFITLKGEINHVLTYYHDDYTQPITDKYFLAMLRHFHVRK
jgi:hypothetical protein